jgi:hypothetical protein
VFFTVRKSVKRFRDDPAWHEEPKGTALLRTEFDPRGWPFNHGDAREENNAWDMFRGTVQGLPAMLFHLTSWYATGGGGGGTRSKRWFDYSVAVLTLPRPLPGTAAIHGPLAVARHISRGRGHDGERDPALPPSAGGCDSVAGHGPGAAVEAYGSDLAFAGLVLNPTVLQLTAEARMGWRIDGDRLIGWRDGRRPMDELLSLAETLSAVVAAFPARVWQDMG